MNKKIPVLVVSACLMWFAYQARDFGVEMAWATTSTYSHLEVITLETPRSFIPKPYAVSQ